MNSSRTWVFKSPFNSIASVCFEIATYSMTKHWQKSRLQEINFKLFRQNELSVRDNVPNRDIKIKGKFFKGFLSSLHIIYCAWKGFEIVFQSSFFPFSMKYDIAWQFFLENFCLLLTLQNVLTNKYNHFGKVQTYSKRYSLEVFKLLSSNDACFIPRTC